MTCDGWAKYRPDGGEFVLTVLRYNIEPRCCGCGRLLAGTTHPMSTNADVAQLEEELERLRHGICDALGPGKPTEPILRALLRGTKHETHGGSHIA